MKKVTMREMGQTSHHHQTHHHLQAKIIATVILAFLPFVIWKFFIDMEPAYFFPLKEKQYALAPMFYILEIGHYWSMICLLNLCAYLSQGKLHIFLQLSYYLAIAHLIMYLGWRYRIPNTVHLSIYFIYGELLYLRLLRKKKWKL